MESVMLESEVLQTLVSPETLCLEHIKNMPNIIEESVSPKIWNALLNHKYHTLTKQELETGIKICHKYRIGKHYNKLISAYINLLSFDDNLSFGNIFCNIIFMDIVAAMIDK